MEIDISIRAGHTFPILLLVILLALAGELTRLKIGYAHILEWNIR